MAADARQILVEFLVRQAFEPVLRAKPDGRSQADQQRLAKVQQATVAEIERFEKYSSASEVLVNFRRDLSSAPAKKVHAELKSLGLPTINDLRGAFEEQARSLHVTA